MDLIRSLEPLTKPSFDVGSWDMGEAHAYGRGRDRFGRDEAPTLAAPPLREAEISATQIKYAAPSHELTTSIPCQAASWLQGAFAIRPFANPRKMAAPSRPPKWAGLMR